jgi:hypothetical protein
MEAFEDSAKHWISLSFPRKTDLHIRKKEYKHIVTYWEKGVT